MSKFKITFRIGKRILYKTIGIKTVQEIEFNNFPFFPWTIQMTENNETCAHRFFNEYLLQFNKHKPLRLKRMRASIPENGAWVGWKNFFPDALWTALLWTYEVRYYANGELKELTIFIDKIYTINQWCKKHCKGSWYIKPGWIYFSDDSDQALFRLFYL